MYAAASSRIDYSKKKTHTTTTSTWLDLNANFKLDTLRLINFQLGSKLSVHSRLYQCAWRAHISCSLMWQSDISHLTGCRMLWRTCTCSTHSCNTLMYPLHVKCEHCGDFVCVFFVFYLLFVIKIRSMTVYLPCQIELYCVRK